MISTLSISPVVSPSLTPTQMCDSYDLQEVIDTLQQTDHIGSVEYHNTMTNGQLIIDNFCDFISHITLDNSRNVVRTELYASNNLIYTVDGGCLDQLIIPICLLNTPITIKIMPEMDSCTVTGNVYHLDIDTKPHIHKLSYYNNISWNNMYLTYDCNDTYPYDYDFGAFKQILSY